MTARPRLLLGMPTRRNADHSFAEEVARPSDLGSVMSRAPRPPVSHDYAHWNRTSARFRKPIRK